MPELFPGALHVHLVVHSREIGWVSLMAMQYTNLEHAASASLFLELPDFLRRCDEPRIAMVYKILPKVFKFLVRSASRKTPASPVCGHYPTPADTGWDRAILNW